MIVLDASVVIAFLDGDGHRALRLPDALVLATAEALGAIALTADRAWPRVSRRARTI